MKERVKGGNIGIFWCVRSGLRKMSSSSSSLSCTKLSIITISALTLQFIGLILFLLGFFPLNPSLSGISGVESYFPPGNDSSRDHNVSNLSPHQLKSLYKQLSGVSPLYDRLILMVVDGLPAEFVLGRDGQPPSKVFKEAMPYTQSLLSNGRAIGYHAKAAPPTVTMPRLKAMVSGVIGGFLDVAFNFNTQALLDDNLIEKFIRIGWKIVMLGDETWLKLFPRMFTRHDGVSSFFVKDTVQVDHNVSRHLSDELNKTDWDLLILHYLGLDHVGHIGGRKSVLMSPKLQEMDEVIQMVDHLAVRTQKQDQGRTLLLVVSDHGMTESGNHGGSSYEEVDSLALFISLENYNDLPASHMTANQVDIAPTLALLFGVPIPKNSVGFLMAEAFKSLRVDQLLRLLELNSWQLMRLLQAQLPHLECGTFSCDVFQDSDESLCGERYHNMEDICCSYMKADDFQKSLKSKGVSSSEDEYRSTYFHCFLKSASEWLSRRATDKSVGFLTSGLGSMLLSCFVLMGILSSLVHKVYMKSSNLSIHGWQLDEIFTLTIVFVVILSMGSSSMVEEEQYIWHFLSSSFFLILLRKTIQVIPYRKSHVALHATCGGFRGNFQIVSIISVLISGRFLRGWHQGGINWVHLPDISKWLEQDGSNWITFLQLLSGVLMIIVCFASLIWPLMSKNKFFMPIALVFLVPGLMVLQHILQYNDGITATSSHAVTISAQQIYYVLAICGLSTLLVVPWFVTFQNPEHAYDNGHTSDIFFPQNWHFYLEFKDCAYVIAWAYIFCWCLLQLLLQKPVNSVPILLLLIQNFCSIWFFRQGNPLLKQWVEVAALYYLGVSGHFGLGNTNSLATIDVAGAFIGVSSYSTFLSGILMFIITYGSPLLSLISMLMYISVKDINIGKHTEHMNFGQLLMMTTGIPCLVPLVVNSILLVAYTIVLLLMRNHLFIWSVFSPKYLYVCAATACVYISLFFVTLSVLYIYTALIIRRRWKLTSQINLKER